MTAASVVVLRGVVPDMWGRYGSGDGGIGEPEFESGVCDLSLVDILSVLKDGDSGGGPGS